MWEMCCYCRQLGDWLDMLEMPLQTPQAQQRGQRKNLSISFVLFKNKRKNLQVILMCPHWSRQCFTSFSIHRNHLKILTLEHSLGFKNWHFHQVPLQVILIQATLNYGILILLHTMDWRHVKNKQRFPTSSTCSGTPAVKFTSLLPPHHQWLRLHTSTWYRHQVPNIPQLWNITQGKLTCSGYHSLHWKYKRCAFEKYL